MLRVTVRVVLGTASLAALVVAACLPTDTRPPPTEVLTTLTGSAIAKTGFVTTDGWKIDFDRYLLSFGNPTMGGSDACDQYADAGYRRIFDATVITPQKVGLDYGLGTCDVRVRFANPNEDSLLGIGVTEDDKTFMRTPGFDLYNKDQIVGISMWVKGRATKGSVVKTFTFSYRTRRVQLQDCVRDPATPTAQKYVFTDNRTVTVDFFVHPEAPFRQHHDPLKKDTWFDPFAKADDLGDKNGDITLDELNAMKIEDVGVPPDDLVLPDAGTPLPSTIVLKTFSDYVWIQQFPHVVGLGPDGTCNVGLGRGFGGGGGGGPF